jgi:hypothetical protein
MVHYPSGSAPLRAGQIQFVEPAAYINNLANFKVATRPNKCHWGQNRPPVYLSIAQLQRQLHYTGNQPDSRTLLQYFPTDRTKLFFDFESYTDTELSSPAAFELIDQQLLQPVLQFIAAKTGKYINADELVYEKAFRWVKKDGLKKWKISCHIIFPDIICTAKRIYDLVEHLELADSVDRAPYRGMLQSSNLYPGSLISPSSICSVCITAYRYSTTIWKDNASNKFRNVRFQDGLVARYCVTRCCWNDLLTD